jgi:uncharacterized repeat protein (TIGR03803 family)
MYGGASGQGTVFKINPYGTGFATLYAFTDSDVDANSWTAKQLTHQDGNRSGTKSVSRSSLRNMGLRNTKNHQSVAAINAEVPAIDRDDAVVYSAPGKCY